MKSKLFPVVLMIVCLFVLANCGTGEKDKTGSAKSGKLDSLVIELAGQNGKSVFEITASGHYINFIPSEAGNFVSGIDSIECGHQYGWLYSVNDTMGMVASDRYITKDGDRIKWHFRKF